MRKSLLGAVIFLVLSTSATAQGLKEGDYFIEGGLRYGFVLHHPQEYDYLKNLYYNSVEVRFGLQTRGENAWERPLGKPILGIALRVSDYVNWDAPYATRQEQRNILGQSIALFGYIQAPFVRLGWFTWYYQLGMGAVYFNKRYNTQTNPQNGLISTRLTPYVSAQTGFEFRLSERFDLGISASAVHASNAGLNMPNWGINELTGIISLRYHLNRNLPKVTEATEEAIGQRNALFVTVDPGWLWSRYNNFYYTKTGVSFGYERRLTSIFRAGVALEMHLAKSVWETRDYRPVYPNGSSYEVPSVLFSSAGLLFGDITFGRFVVQIGVGGYFYRNPDKFDLSQTGAYSGTIDKMPSFYEKVGFRIDLGKSRRHFVGVSIRAHFPVADYLAFTYGYRIWRF